MPVELLFDIDDIDMGAIAIDGEAVGALNPQCGHMRFLDHIIWTNDDLSRAVGVHQIPADAFWIPGHIPGRPLMPGVLMIEAAAQVSSVMYRRKTDERGFLGFTRCDEVVFRGQVAPESTLLLLGEEVSFRRRRFITRCQGVVDDQIAFEARITGMVI